MRAVCVCACPGTVAIEIDLSDVACWCEGEREMETETETGGFSQWRYSHYFQFIARKDKNIRVKCTLCRGDKCLSTAANSMSNLSKHLSAQHGNTKLVAKDPARRSFEGVTQQPTPPKQAKLFSSLGVQQVTQNEMNRLVAGFIVEDMLPLSTIESPRFKKILDKIPATRKPTSDRKTFSHYLDKCYSDMESKLKRTFESLDHVSTTADIWSANNKSYLGMTVHWIDSISFKREKAALACKRVRGRHTYDVIASEIEQVHSAFGLSHKVTACVTDNGSNFVKAFRMFESHPDDGSDSDEPSDEEEEEEEVTFTDVAEALSTESDETFSLPPHLRCASHTLNLISKMTWRNGWPVTMTVKQFTEVLSPSVQLSGQKVVALLWLQTRLRMC